MTMLLVSAVNKDHGRSVTQAGIKIITGCSVIKFGTTVYVAHRLNAN